MKLAEIKKLSADQLKTELATAREELMNLRFRHATGQLEKTAEIPAKKRHVARILTILKDKRA